MDGPPPSLPCPDPSEQNPPPSHRWGRKGERERGGRSSREEEEKFQKKIIMPRSLPLPRPLSKWKPEADYGGRGNRDWSVGKVG